MPETPPRLRASPPRYDPAAPEIFRRLQRDALNAPEGRRWALGTDPDHSVCSRSPTGGRVRLAAEAALAWLPGSGSVGGSGIHFAHQQGRCSAGLRPKPLVFCQWLAGPVLALRRSSRTTDLRQCTASTPPDAFGRGRARRRVSTPTTTGPAVDSPPSPLWARAGWTSPAMSGLRQMRATPSRQSTQPNPSDEWFRFHW